MPDSADGEKPAASARDQWRERFAAHARNGLSMKQFCKEHGVAEHSFYAWRKRLREGGPIRFALVDRAGRRTRQNWIWS